MKNYYYQEGVEVVPNAWSSELSTDLLGLIAEKIRSLSLSEYIRFGSVCLEWRSFSIQNYQPIKLPNKLPVLLIPLPSLPITDHQNKISSSPSSSSSSSICDEEEEEEEEEGEEEEVEEEEEEEEEEGEEEDKEPEQEELEPEPVELEPEEPEPEPVVVRVRVRPQKYYNPKEIWQGQDHKQRHRSARNFYSLSEKMVYHDFPLPVPYYKNIRGSSHGWLVTVEEQWGSVNGREEPYLTVRLFNPFRTDNNEIQLPPLVNGYPGNIDEGDGIHSSYFLKKAFLSANPSSLSDPTTQLVVLGVYGCTRLAFCRPGDKFWTPLDLEDYRPIMDIICYNDQFYAILQSGYVFAFVFDAAQPFPTPIVTEAFSPPKENGFVNPRGFKKRYLVESEGDLLQVRRNIGILSLQESLEQIGLPTPIEIGGYISSQFLVFKLDPTTGEWVEIKNLNNRIIFIGYSMSISILASDFTGWSKPNSIYYIDNNYESFVCNPLSGPHDIGIFNLEDGSFERHYEAESKTIMPPPIWIQPML